MGGVDWYSGCQLLDPRQMDFAVPCKCYVWPIITQHNSQIPALEGKANRFFFLALVTLWMLCVLNIGIKLILLTIRYVCCGYIMLSWLLTILDAVAKQIIALATSHIFSINPEYSPLYCSKNLFLGERWHIVPLCSIIWRSVSINFK